MLAVPRLRCVVLTPTRELALQVASVFSLLLGDRGSHDPRLLRVVCLAGETAPTKRQKPGAAAAAAAAAEAAATEAAASAEATGRLVRLAAPPADVLVCTPGRFVDAAQVYIHHKKRGIKGRGLGCGTAG